MEIRVKREDCCGCGACEAACTAGAIQMRSDKEGFLYPYVDKDACIECGRCGQVCPVLNSSRVKNNRLYFGAQNRNEKARYSSSSGGIFSVLAQYVIWRQGVVYGAGYGKNMEVMHKPACTMEAVENIKRTKYVQSRMTGIYQKIEEDLKNNRWVLFCGTPCQAYALKLFLNKRNYPKLILVDLVCYGVPSPGIWRSYVQYLESKYKGKMTDFLFRDKRNGDNGHTRSCIIGGIEHVCPMAQDFYCGMYFANYILRPSCHNCKFCTVERESDFTIGDFWGIENVNPDMDDGMGTSMIILHTDKARDVWESIKEELEWFECRKSDFCQPRLLSPTQEAKKRKYFMSLYRILPFSMFIKLASGFVRLRRYLRILKDTRRGKTDEKNSKKVGILTFHCADNYGAMLQAYGLKTYLRRIGVNADIVRYEPFFMTGRHWWIPYVPINGIAGCMWIGFCRWKTHLQMGSRFFKLRANMRSFREKYLIETGTRRLLFSNQLKRLPYRYYIVGSDQIWNPNITCGLRKVYFGGFANRRKKKVIAYAASLGGATLPRKYDKKFSEYMRNIDAVSVREDAATAYIERFYNGEIKAVLDPVFFLKKSEWEQIEKKPGRKGYIFVYITESDRRLSDYVLKLSCEKSLPVVEVKTTASVAEKIFDVNYTAGPAEFLGYIHKADYVVTNSFHAVAFSIIYQKKFVAFLHSSFGTRIHNIIKIHGLENHLYQEERKLEIDAFTDWIEVERRTEENVKKSGEFLKTHINTI